MHAAALLLAWALDHRFGEPRSAWHPVAWFGRLAAPLGRAARALPPAWAFAAGALLWCGLVGTVAGIGWQIERHLRPLPPIVALPLLALALKPAFAWRMLCDEVAAVEAALQQGLDAGRARVALLCSRDVSTLDAAGVRATAIETLAENFDDSLVAPLCWFVLAGLPGAWAWRAVNTLDAMWGYRGAWEWAGKWAARADDLLAWLPARLSAVLLWRPGLVLAALAREAARTPSPNGGWPMAAMAWRVGCRLAKPGVYALNDSAPPPQARHVAEALRIARRAARVAFALAVLVLVARDWA